MQSIQSIQGSPQRRQHTARLDKAPAQAELSRTRDTTRGRSLPNMVQELTRHQGIYTRYIPSKAISKLGFIFYFLVILQWSLFYGRYFVISCSLGCYFVLKLLKYCLSKSGKTVLVTPLHQSKDFSFKTFIQYSRNPSLSPSFQNQSHRLRINIEPLNSSSSRSDSSYLRRFYQLSLSSSLPTNRSIFHSPASSWSRFRRSPDFVGHSY